MNDLIKRRDYIGLEKLENYELTELWRKGKKINPREIEKRISQIGKTIANLHKPVDKVALQEVIRRLDAVKSDYYKKNYFRCEILLKSIDKLFGIIRKS